MSTNIDKGKAPSAAGESLTIDPTIWEAISNTSSNFPPIGSTVYYYINTQIQQFPFASEFQLAAVNLHADPYTEELFATFSLKTEISSLSPAPTKKYHEGGCRNVSSVAKTLTEAETNYGGKIWLDISNGSDEVFKYLGQGEKVDVYDLNNRRWTFRHVVSGRIAPRRFLTSGWGDFVSSKMLVAGDGVVFVRDEEGVIFIGVRRCDDEGFARRMEDLASTSSPCRKKLFKRSVMEELVMDAARWEEEGGEGTLEGRYYPDIKLPVYLVDKDVIINAMRVPWCEGMPVMKKWERDDGFVYWRLGSVIGVSQDSTFTPWCTLQVRWDKTKKITNENPWELKPLSDHY